MGGMNKLPGAGRMRLDAFVEGNLLWASKAVLDYDARKSVMTSEEKYDLSRANKAIKPVLGRLCAKLKTDKDFTDLRDLIEASYIIGGLTMLTKIQPKIASKQGGKTGGEKSAKTRNDKADMEWRNEGFRLAQSYLRTHPTAPYTDIATHIDNHFKGESPRSYDTYKKQVSAWFKHGKLKRP
jgi:hypothetical protein